MFSPSTSAHATHDWRISVTVLFNWPTPPRRYRINLSRMIANHVYKTQSVLILNPYPGGEWIHIFPKRFCACESNEHGSLISHSEWQSVALQVHRLLWSGNNGINTRNVGVAICYSHWNIIGLTIKQDRFFEVRV